MTVYEGLLEILYHDLKKINLGSRSTFFVGNLGKEQRRVNTFKKCPINAYKLITHMEDSW